MSTTDCGLFDRVRESIRIRAEHAPHQKQELRPDLGLPRLDFENNSNSPCLSSILPRLSVSISKSFGLERPQKPLNSDPLSAHLPARPSADPCLPSECAASSSSTRECITRKFHQTPVSQVIWNVTNTVTNERSNLHHLS